MEVKIIKNSMTFAICQLTQSGKVEPVREYDVVNSILPTWNSEASNGVAVVKLLARSLDDDGNETYELAEYPDSVEYKGCVYAPHVVQGTDIKKGKVWYLRKDLILAVEKNLRRRTAGRLTTTSRLAVVDAPYGALVYKDAKILYLPDGKSFGSWTTSAGDYVGDVWPIEDGITYIASDLNRFECARNPILLGPGGMNHQFTAMLPYAEIRDFVHEGFVAFMDEWKEQKASGRAALVLAKIQNTKHMALFLRANSLFARHPHFQPKTGNGTADALRRESSCPHMAMESKFAIPSHKDMTTPVYPGMEDGMYFLGRSPMNSFNGATVHDFSKSNPAHARELERLSLIEFAGTMSAIVGRKGRATFGQKGAVLYVPRETLGGYDIVSSMSNAKLGFTRLFTVKGTKPPELKPMLELNMDFQIHILSAYDAKSIISIPCWMWVSRGGDYDGDLAQIAKILSRSFFDAVMRLASTGTGEKLKVKKHGGTLADDRAMLKGAAEAPLGLAVNTFFSLVSYVQAQESAGLRDRNEIAVALDGTISDYYKPEAGYGKFSVLDWMTLCTFMFHAIQLCVDASKNCPLPGQDWGWIRNVMLGITKKLDITIAPTYRWKRAMGEGAFKTFFPLYVHELDVASKERIKDKEFRKTMYFVSQWGTSYIGSTIEQIYADKRQGVVEIFDFVRRGETDALPLNHFFDWAPEVSDEYMGLARSLLNKWYTFQKATTALMDAGKININDVDEAQENDEVWRKIADKYYSDDNSRRAVAAGMWRILHSQQSDQKGTSCVFETFPNEVIEFALAAAAREINKKKAGTAFSTCLYGVGYNFDGEAPDTIKCIVDVLSIDNGKKMTATSVVRCSGQNKDLLGMVTIPSGQALRNGMKAPVPGRYEVSAERVGASTWQALFVKLS